jgi:dTDP-4-amino-4,6-dideoxygalactose transaminase
LPPKLAINGGPQTRVKPFPSWPVFDQEEENALLQVFRSGQWGRYLGDRVTNFERMFADSHDAKYGVAVMNGSVALRIALLAAGIQAGDEVIVPSYTFIATATAVIEANGVPIFADISPYTYCLDPGGIEAAITSRTKMIIPVHFAGQAAEMDRIMEIARRHDLIVIEDAAHAHGAAYKGARLGSIGDLGCFSFQASKNMTAGEGGMILTNDADYERLCRALHTCGRYPEGAWYDHYLPGGNYRMTEFQAALLQIQLSRLDDQTETRDKNGQYLNQELAAVPGIHPLQRGYGETRHAYHLYIFRYQPAEFDGLSRARFLAALKAEGIPNSAGYGLPLYKQPLFLERAFGPFTGFRETQPTLDYSFVTCPVSEDACYTEACWIPQHVLLGAKKDMDDIVRAIQKIYDHRQELLS